MVKVKDVYDFIDSLAPFDCAMDFDNSGLLVGNINLEVNSVLVSLDITNEVVNEAKSIGANLILSHHPVIFNSIKNIYSDSVVHNLIKGNISAICAHTNLDIANDIGVNTCLAKVLNIKNIKPLSVYKTEKYNKIVVFVPEENSKDIINTMARHGAGLLGNYSECSFSSEGKGTFRPNKNSNPYIGECGRFEEIKESRVEMICSKSKTQKAIDAMLNVHPYEVPAYDIFETSAVESDIALGLVGDLCCKVSADEFAHYVKDKLKCNGLRYFNFNDNIKTIALCSGAGGNLISNAIEKGFDAFVTGEIKHHEILLAEKNNITVIDAGHFKTEDVVIKPLIKKLKQKFDGINFIKSQVFVDKSLYI